MSGANGTPRPGGWGGIGGRGDERTAHMDEQQQDR
jgi:hypothetical protein